jgi:hypothetical protein
VLQKEVALELNLQKGKDQAPSVLVSTNEKSYAASAHTYTSLSRQCRNSGNSVQQQRRWSHLIQRHGVAHDGLKHKHTNIVSAKDTNLHEANLKTRSEKPVVRSSTSRPADGCADLYARNSRNFEVGDLSENQAKIVSPKYREFRSNQAVWQYRPRNSVRSIIMSVAPGTKPGPQWCPAGLTHTQK